ncbi:MAG: DNA oxidative demethylase AlkB [Proteobacteria bacterium]|nr:DNA oxidative demethylase AlkB [Pseudomonadota bacterium]
MTLSLFADEPRQTLSEGAWLLRGFALAEAAALVEDIAALTRRAPFRHLVTPSGHRMSVAMSNCGALGWVSDRRGYRYQACDPDSGEPWPAMPAAFSALALRAARAAGFEDFHPDACLVNRYARGARLSLHQDKDEGDLSQPIVSVSLGVPARFLWGGARRQDSPRRIALAHGDVVVWGGPARLTYHGVAELMEGQHELTGAYRYNLTFRKAGAG